jgi:hypothetical protein
VAVHFAYTGFDGEKKKEVAANAKKLQRLCERKKRIAETCSSRGITDDHLFLEPPEKEHHQQDQPDQAKSAIWV